MRGTTVGASNGRKAEVTFANGTDGCASSVLVVVESCALDCAASVPGAVKEEISVEKTTKISVGRRVSAVEIGSIIVILFYNAGKN